MKEIELKLLVEPGRVPALRKRIGTLAGARSVTRKLRTIYLDTHDERLAAAGIALRLRQEDGAWTQTLKRARRLEAGLSQTEEIDRPAPGGRVALDALPPGPRAELAALIGDLPVSPHFETVINRSRWVVAIDGARVEVALDRGEIRADARAEPLIELEMELLEGQPDTLFALARRLFPTGPVTFSGANKAARGRRVAAGEPAVPPPAPRNAVAVPLDRETSTEQAATAILAECAAQVAANVEAVRADPAPEGAHQLRVGLRRLRSALRMLRPAIGRDTPAGRPLETLGQEARWLAGEVGRLRDLQVAAGDLVAPAARAAPHEPGFPALETALAEAVTETRAALLATLEGERAAAFLIDLAETVALRPWAHAASAEEARRLARPFAKLARKAARKAEKRAVQRADGIATLDHDARHELRKALKTLRYTVEFAAPLWPAETTRAYLKALKKMQTVFGDLNDAAMAEELFMGAAAPGGRDPGAMRAAGRLIGARLTAADHAWDGVLARWQAFEAAKRPWA